MDGEQSLLAWMRALPPLDERAKRARRSRGFAMDGEQSLLAWMRALPPLDERAKRARRSRGFAMDGKSPAHCPSSRFQLV
jgi:hypothetical protein